MDNYKGFTDFAVLINRRLHIHNKFIITDGDSQVSLQTIEDLPQLLKKEWLMLISPMVDWKDGVAIPYSGGIELVFRERLEVAPIYDEEGTDK